MSYRITRETVFGLQMWSIYLAGVYLDSYLTVPEAEMKLLELELRGLIRR